MEGENREGDSALKSAFLSVASSGSVYVSAAVGTTAGAAMGGPVGALAGGLAGTVVGAAISAPRARFMYGKDGCTETVAGSRRTIRFS
jgi:hypothetical protein